MSGAGEAAVNLITLCMVIQSRSGNLANALHSVNKVAGQIVIVHTGGAGEQMVQHLASEYDAQYLPVPDDPNESALLNTALDQVRSPWALFLHQEEVLHVADPPALTDWLKDVEAVAIEFPILSFEEPRNYYFDARLVRTGSSLRWEHEIYPTLQDSLEGASAAGAGREQVTEFMPHAAIISLGTPAPEEWELRDAIVRIEKELDRAPESVRSWFYLAEAARALKEWDRASAAVEEGLNVVSRDPDVPRREPMAVSGLIGMLCNSLLAGKHYPEKTVESLWIIHQNMEANGRFSEPLGRLLLAADRKADAIAAQHRAVESYFGERRYYLGMEEGLYQPIQLAWEMEQQLSHDELLNSIMKIQALFNKHQIKIQALLQYISGRNQPLFIAIRDALQTGLAG